MRALRKGQARPWCLQPGISGEVRLVERAFGIGPAALTEAMGMLNHHVAAAAGSAQSDSLPLTAANLCNRAVACSRCLISMQITRIDTRRDQSVALKIDSLAIIGR